MRKGPSLSYDTPDPDASGYENLDEYYVFFGGLNRYDFKLLGKREMVVPYNNNRFYTRPVSEVAGPLHANPDDLRYELHRVWVLEGKCRAGQDCGWPRRTLYLDEDSWQALISDRYDGRGTLWRTGMAMAVQIPDVPVMLADGYVLMDLYQHRYIVQGMHNEEKPPRYGDTSIGPKDYTAEALRRFGRR